MLFICSATAAEPDEDHHITLTQEVVASEDIISKLISGEPVRYDNVTISGSLELAELQGSLSQPIKITNSIFLGPVRFAAASFDEPLDLQGSIFRDNVNFFGCRFAGGAGFAGVTFEGQADLRNTYFGGQASFLSAQFSEDASF